jgi:hypothetical protein
MAHRVGTLSRRQKPLQNRTPLIVYKHEVEDALEYIVETVENAEGHKTLTALGVEKGEADVSPLILLSRSSGRRQGHQSRWQQGIISRFQRENTRKMMPRAPDHLSVSGSHFLFVSAKPTIIYVYNVSQIIDYDPIPLSYYHTSLSSTFFL